MTDRIEELEINLLLEALYQRFHYDFRDYSKASITRRLRQLKERLGYRNYSAMLEGLLHDPAVFPQMVGYLTVQVSEMFRDPSYFRALREKVVPHLRTYPSLKVWVAGCSGGEELYSLAILFREEGLEKRTMFYATDINPRALEIAAAGVYELDRIKGFTENHQQSGGRSSLSDYYTAAYGRASFDRTLRERVVFSDHSLVTDAVFGEMHLISCRNVLIYFNNDLQDRTLKLFSDSLIRKGFLGLGSKESLRFSSQSDAFQDFMLGERIYQRRDP
ncbi:MAG TPA: CheR family methyltransferase [Dyella sp.]|uniref:CheR family methyltransferase n=1 Tax=Dyella sp. TaxID=1869338 RepID=UPI002D77570D|nr:CheR family methyltransferase [Dyella sp.]HET6553137.1 CheR family methyltransferase [Dyella sp.]